MPTDAPILDTEQTGLAPLPSSAPPALPQSTPAKLGWGDRIAHFAPVLASALGRIAPYLGQIGDSLVSAGGSPLQQESLAERNNLSLRRQQLAMTQRNSDLEAQLAQKQLNDYLSPQAKSDLALKQFQSEQNIRQSSPERQNIVDAQGNVFSTNPFDPNDVRPVTVSRDVTVSSPQNPQIPFDPSQTITRPSRSQLQIAPKESGSDFERYYDSLKRTGQQDTPQNRLSAFADWQRNSGATDASPFKAWRDQFVQQNGRQPNAGEIQSFQNSGQALRISGMENLRQDNYLDTTSGGVNTMTAGEFAAANKANPGQFIKYNGQVSNALKGQSLINDIRDGVAQMRSANNALPDSGLGSDARALMSLAAKSPENALNTVVSGMASKQLSGPEQDYLIAHATLLERAMSLRGLQGQGAGSDQQRAAIAAMLPSFVTADKGMAEKQLKTFENNVSNVALAIPKIGKRSAGGNDPMGIR